MLPSSLPTVTLWFLAPFVFDIEVESDTFLRKSVHMRIARRFIPGDDNIEGAM
jgi:hypothetical protein